MRRIVRRIRPAQKDGFEPAPAAKRARSRIPRRVVGSRASTAPAVSRSEKLRATRIVATRRPRHGGCRVPNRPSALHPGDGFAAMLIGPRLGD